MSPATWLRLLCLASGTFSLLVAGHGGPFRYQYFKTEPSLSSPVIQILNKTANESTIAPGFVLIDTVSARTGKLLCPLMYDSDGTLIWNGVDIIKPGLKRTQNTHVCDFLGEKDSAICITEVSKNIDTNYRIFDRTYKEVGSRNYSGTSNFVAPNQHEFTTTNNGNTFIQAVYTTRAQDLTSIGGLSSAIVTDGCFQEVDVDTGKELFRWCSLDHISCANTTHGGPGAAQQASANETAWDCVHLNSIDKNEEGDYLVSIRHFDMIAKIAGPHSRQGVDPGTILWTLGGPYSDFKFEHYEKDGFNLQHDARFISTGAEETFLSLHDNHGSGQETWSGAKECAAKVFKVNNKTMTVHLEHSYRFPEKLGCTAQGSARILPNGNMFVGWGKRPYFTEFSPTGDILLHAQFTKPETQTIFNYRTLKHTWTGKPHWPPKLVAYSKCCSCKVVAYASWNGATEVHAWRFYTSNSGTGNASWTPVDGEVKKVGFETKVELTKGFVPFVWADALDASGAVLGSVSNATFVPSSRVRQHCNDDECTRPLDFAYDAADDQAYRCRATFVPSLYAVAVILLCVEMASYLFKRVLEILVLPVRGVEDLAFEEQQTFLLGASELGKARTGKRIR